MPAGKYTIFAWYKYKGKTYGKFLDTDIPPTLEKMISDLKGFSLTGEEILNLKDSVPEGNSSINFDIYDKSNRSSSRRTKKKSKVPYDFNFSFYKKSGRQSSTFTPNSKSLTYIYVINAKGKIVVRKKMKTGKCMKKGLRGKLSSGTYLVITWCDLEKDKRIGNVYFLSK